MVRLSVNATGHKMVAPLAPVPTLFTVMLPLGVEVAVPVMIDPAVDAPHSKTTLVGDPGLFISKSNVAPAFTVKVPFTVVVGGKVFEALPDIVRLV